MTTKAARAKRRHRRDIDRLATHLRELGAAGGHDRVLLDSELTTLRALADRADEIEAAGGRSDQSFVLVLSRLHEIRRELAGRLNAAGAASGSPIADALAAVMGSAGSTS